MIHCIEISIGSIAFLNLLPFLLQNPVDNWTLDISNDILAIVDACRMAKEFDSQVLSEILKGTKNPGTHCPVVGLLSHWPPLEVDRLLRFLCRKRILNRSVSLQKGSHKLNVTLTIGDNDDLGFEEEVPFPINRSNINEIEGQKYRATADPLDALKMAGCKFVTPDVVEMSTETLAMRPVNGDYRGCF